MGRDWMLEDDALSFSDEGMRSIERIKDLLAVRMSQARKRHRHSLGVARTAASLAVVYDLDVFDAYVAGLVHDWDKVLSDDEVLARAIRYGIAVEGDPALSAPLLHGPVAARELPELFPDLSGAVLQAVSRHTLAAPDMSALDMAVFVADGIEPNRHGDYAEAQRDLVGSVSLEELFLTSFAGGISYVVETRRYLYPGTVAIYNGFVMKKGNA